MATEAQYRCFRDIFDSEIARYERLVDRGKLFLSVITLYIGLFAVAADKVVPKIHGSWVAISAYLVSFAAFVLAMVLVVLAIGIYTYKYPTDPEKVLRKFDDHWPSEAEFFDARMAELATAFTNNHPVNARRASLLKKASFCMLVGIACQAVVLASLAFVAS